jgi:autotransporter-associated beta strand protein
VGRGNLIINGGVVRVSSAAQRTVLNNVQIGGNFQVGSSSNKSLTLAGTTLLTGTGVTRTITGGFTGTAAADTNTVTFSGAISEAGAGNGLTFANSTVTHVVLSAVNTYTGNTTVNGGTFTLADNAGLKFVIGADGVNNKIFGNGTITLNGDFTFDLSGAGTTAGDSWSIIDSGTIASTTFGTSFSVVGFTDNLDNTWSKINGGTSYLFNESNGMLSVAAIPEPSTYVALMGLAAGLAAVGTRSRQRRKTDAK